MGNVRSPRLISFSTKVEGNFGHHIGHPSSDKLSVKHIKIFGAWNSSEGLKSRSTTDVRNLTYVLFNVPCNFTYKICLDEIKYHPRNRNEIIGWRSWKISIKVLVLYKMLVESLKRLIKQSKKTRAHLTYILVLFSTRKLEKRNSK